VEATSHGLAQHRVAACEFDVAAVTNITREHLDYHLTFEDYRAAKGALFRGLSTAFRKSGMPKVAILNADDPSFDYLKALCPERCFTYGLQVPGDITAEDIQLSPAGSCFKAVIPGESFQVRTPLPGMFNVYNILASIAVGFSQGVPADAMQQGVLSVTGVTGRMERIDLGQDFAVVVDFAHTPNALQNALQTARTLTRGKLIVVFGCAGLRDRSKRPRMGEVAGRLADYTFLTAEDPRTEDVNAIIAEIAAGCLSSGRREGVDCWRVPDRSDAIARAINLARSGDLVIITGKGHEQSMCFGTTEYPWSDHEAARAALRAAPSSH
jgi:UDP-N-acetylmuramoyl-L-alanyl-D-glutamate--2,6-diaminopimelate ligase